MLLEDKDGSPLIRRYRRDIVVSMPVRYLDWNLGPSLLYTATLKGSNKRVKQYTLEAGGHTRDCK